MSRAYGWRASCPAGGVTDVGLALAPVSALFSSSLGILCRGCSFGRPLLELGNEQKQTSAAKDQHQKTTAMESSL